MSAVQELMAALLQISELEVRADLDGNGWTHLRAMGRIAREAYAAHLPAEGTGEERSDVGMLREEFASHYLRSAISGRCVCGLYWPCSAQATLKRSLRAALSAYTAPTEEK